MMLCIEIPTRTRDQRRFYLPVTAVSTLKPLQALNQGGRWAGGAEPGQTSSRSVTDSRDSKVPGPLVGGKRFWPLVHQDPRRSSCLQLQAFHVADTFCPLISCYPAKKKLKQTNAPTGSGPRQGGHQVSWATGSACVQRVQQNESGPAPEAGLSKLHLVDS